MIDVLVTRALKDKTIKPIKDLPNDFLSTTELEMKEWLLDYNKSYSDLPSKERFEDSKFSHYWNERYPDDPINDVFDLTVEDLKQRYFSDKMHVLQEKMYHESVDYHELVAIGKRLSRATRLEATNIFNIDRSDLYSSVKDENFVHFGFDGLDKPTGGIGPGEYCLLAARPGIGKSFISFYLATKWAREGRKVLVVSAEMAIVQIASRIDSLLASFNPLILRTKENPKELPKYLKEVQKELDKIKKKNGNIVIPYQGVITPMMVDSFLEENDIDVLVADGIYLWGSDKGKTYNNDWQHQSDVTNRIKQMSLDHNIPVFATTQFKRTGKQAGFDLEDIAFTDDVGKTADLALAAWQTEGMKNRMEIEAMKNRNGGALANITLVTDWSRGYVKEHIPTIGKVS